MNLNRFKNENGFTLSEIALAVVILLILATVVTSSLVKNIDSSKVVQMKENAGQIENAALNYYLDKGVLPMLEEAEVSDEVKGLLYQQCNPNCNSNLKGSVLVKEGEEIIDKDTNIVYAGTLEGEKLNIEEEINLDDVKVYTLDEELLKLYLPGFSKNEFEKYVIVDFQGTNIAEVPPVEVPEEPPVEDPPPIVEPEEPVIPPGHKDDPNCGIIPEDSTCVASRADLENIRNDLDGDYILGGLIDLSDSEWLPIGSEANPFTGTLDGRNNSITNMHLDVNPSSTGSGLFGAIEDAEITNVVLDDFYVDGGADVGSLSGYAKGDVVVTGSHFEGLMVGHGNQNSNGGNAGGLFGHLDASSRALLSDIYVEVQVNQEGNNHRSDNVGALFGTLEAEPGFTAKNITLIGNVKGKDNVGMIAGSAKTNGAYFESLTVSGVVDGKKVTGGLFGLLDNNTTANEVFLINDSTFNINVSGQGRYVGENTRRVSKLAYINNSTININRYIGGGDTIVSVN